MKSEERTAEYIKNKSIYLDAFYTDCNIVGCDVKDAILNFQGNNYCMKHFVEFIRGDKEEEDIAEFISDLKRLKIWANEHKKDAYDPIGSLIDDIDDTLIAKWEGE